MILQRALALALGTDGERGENDEKKYLGGYF